MIQAAACIICHVSIFPAHAAPNSICNVIYNMTNADSFHVENFS